MSDICINIVVHKKLNMRSGICINIVVCKNSICGQKWGTTFPPHYTTGHQNVASDLG